MRFTNYEILPHDRRNARSTYIGAEGGGIEMMRAAASGGPEMMRKIHAAFSTTTYINNATGNITPALTSKIWNELIS